MTPIRFSVILLCLSLYSAHSFTPTVHNKPHFLMAWSPNSPEQSSLSNELSISPLDEYNAALLNEVRPYEYENPNIAWGTVWDLVVIGAGAGGLVSSRQVR